MVSIEQDGDFEFEMKLQSLQGHYKRNVTIKVAQHSLLFFRVQYQKQGTNKDGFVAWKQRKYKVNRKLLVETGYMRDSLKLTSRRFEKIRIEVQAPYAEYHQNGTDHVPQREMLYQSNELDKQLKSIIGKELAKIFK